MADNKLKKLDDASELYRKAREEDGSLIYGVKSENSWAYPIVKDKHQRMKEYRAEARRMVSMLNKRIKRLEETGYTDTPAYKGLVESGVPKFSVKGKNFNELKAEVARMERFKNAVTSTIRGANNSLKRIADVTEFNYDSLDELRGSMGNFFELASKAEQHLRSSEDIASAIGYNQIWKAINKYVSDNNIALDDAKTDINDLIEKVVDIAKNSTPTTATSNPAPDGSTYTGKFNFLE